MKKIAIPLICLPVLIPSLFIIAAAAGMYGVSYLVLHGR